MARTIPNLRCVAAADDVRMIAPILAVFFPDVWISSLLLKKRYPGPLPCMHPITSSKVCLPDTTDHFLFSVRVCGLSVPQGKVTLGGLFLLGLREVQLTVSAPSP